MDLKNLYTFYSSDFAILKNIFLSTIKDNYNIHCKLVNLHPGKSCWLFKTNYIIEAIKENFNNAIIISDIDIQFFKSTRNTLESGLKQFDILVQKEYACFHPNIGFMVLNCNRTMLNFWKDVLKNVELGMADQYVVNILLAKQQNIKWNFLPREYWAYRDYDSKPPKGVILHHAIWASDGCDPNAKLNQMRTIRREISPIKLY